MAPRFVHVPRWTPPRTGSSSRSAALRRAPPALAADRRLQRREPRGHARGAACLAVRRRRRARRTRRVQCAPGRMEGYRLPGGALAVVDYAHTPDALRRRSRQCARMHAAACRGLRLRRGAGPRQAAAMGETAERSRTRHRDRRQPARRGRRRHRRDDPRAAYAARAQRAVERDRERAIGAAVAEARPGDAMLIAGKGHEAYQVVGGERHRFSDRECLRCARGSHR